MTNRLCSVLATLIVGSGLLAGCGGSSSSSSPSSTPAPTTTTAVGTSSSPAGGTSTSSPGGSTTAAQAVALCKSRVAAVPTLSPAVKAQLEGLCAQAGSGNPTAIRKLLAQVCAEILKSLPPQERATIGANCPKT